ncbi:MAG: transposase, partial [Elusimicrobia bacterium]|nr:transposase [Elusimicrobiota bacterium]
MPRQARIDTPGLLHHVISRGLERREIFKTIEDYQDFVDRIDTSLQKSPNQILAWALMPNHFHLLIRSGSGGITRFMRRLMSGYATSFNARHKRVGYLFQNRYKSIVCEEDTYLKELVRYIHLNPLRAQLVKDLEGLRRYPFTGHAVLMGMVKHSWQEKEFVLALFGRNEKEGHRRYEEYVREGTKEGNRPDLVGGGLKRSHGGNWPSKKERESYDSRILGSGGFVESVLKEVEKDDRSKSRFQKMGWENFVSVVAKAQGIERDRLFEKGRRQSVSDGKAILIYVGTTYFGKTNKAMANMLCMAEPPASRAKDRGRELMEKA